METQQLNNKDDDDNSSVSSPSISGSSFSSATSETCITRCCDIPASPYPVYLVATLFFISAYVSDTTFNSVLYNKLCYERYGLVDECSNSTFTSTHPDLQVSYKPNQAKLFINTPLCVHLLSWFCRLCKYLSPNSTSTSQELGYAKAFLRD